MTSPTQTPSERLARSRERMRLALGGVAPAAPGQPPVKGNAGRWWLVLHRLPGAAIASQAARQWWTRHPLRTSTQLALTAAGAVVRPLAQRHPWELVAGAFVVGGLIGWRRPSIFRPTLLAGLLPQLLIASLAAHARSAADAPRQPSGLRVNTSRPSAKNA